MQVSINQKQFGEVELMLKGLALDGPKILSRTLNATAAKGRKVATDEIAKKYTLKTPYIRKQLSVSKANRKKLTARLVAAKRGLLMPRYKHRVVKRGVNVNIRRSGGKKSLQGAFKTHIYVGSKKVDVIAYPNKSGARYNTGSRKMKVLYAPSVSQLFAQFRNQIDTELMDYLEDRTDKEIGAALRGY